MGSMLSRDQDNFSPQLLKEREAALQRQLRIKTMAQTNVVKLPSVQYRSSPALCETSYQCTGRCNLNQVLLDMAAATVLSKTKQLEQCQWIVMDIKDNPELYDAKDLDAICIHNMGREIVYLANETPGTKGVTGYIEYSDTRRKLAMQADTDFRVAMRNN